MNDHPLTACVTNFTSPQRVHSSFSRTKSDVRPMGCVICATAILFGIAVSLAMQSSQSCSDDRLRSNSTTFSGFDLLTEPPPLCHMVGELLTEVPF